LTLLSNSLRSLFVYLAIFAIVIAGALLTFAQAPQNPAHDTSRFAGYTSQSSNAERDWEKKFQAGIVAENLRQSMRRLSARPHHVGSAYDKDNADWILSKFKEWGFDAHIETFKVLFPTPKERVVEMIEPTKFRAKLQEPPVPGDPTSDQTAEQLQSTLYRAYIIGEMASIYGDPNLINTRFDKIASVGKDDIQRVAKTYLTEDNRTVVTTLPKPKPESAQKGAN